MISLTQPTRGKRCLAILAVATVLLGFLCFGLGRVRSLHAKLTDDSGMIYKECLDETTFHKVQEKRCGIDQKATAENRKKLEELQERAVRAKQPLKPAEEAKVEEFLDERFGVTSDDMSSEVISLLERADQRVASVLSAKRYRFSKDQVETLNEVLDWLQNEQKRVLEYTMTQRDVRALRTDVGAQMGRVTAIVTSKQREMSAELPQVENLVTKIDYLVSQVGTVIRDLERDGIRVPSDVERGHRQAVQLVTQAKRSCSTSRPAGCAQLRQVLETIESMREPLCALDSPTLTFCH